MLAVCLGLRTFLPDLRGHHVLVRSDSMMVVSYINRQGGLSSRRLFILAERLLRWAQLNLRSLRAAHVPGKLNLGADMLSRSNIPTSGRCTHKRFRKFGKSSAGQRSTYSPKKTTLIAKLTRPLLSGKRFGQPELWVLHLWPLDGSFRTFPRVCQVLFIRLEHHL